MKVAYDITISIASCLINWCLNKASVILVIESLSCYLVGKSVFLLRLLSSNIVWMSFLNSNLLLFHILLCYVYVFNVFVSLCYLWCESENFHMFRHLKKRKVLSLIYVELFLDLSVG